MAKKVLKKKKATKEVTPAKEVKQETKAPAKAPKETKPAKEAKAPKKVKEEKAVPTNDKVGAYLFVDHVGKIEWETETDKTVKAFGKRPWGSDFKDSPLRKDRIMNYDEKKVEAYNNMTKQIKELQDKQKSLLDEMGMKFQ